MHIIAIANQKGGCGKTTTAINLGAELGRREQRVLLIDMDPQGHASLGMGIGKRDLPGLYEVFSDEATLCDVILKDAATGVDLIPANLLLAAAEPLLTDQPGRERQLLALTHALEGRYDYALIDCPPSLGLLSINALRAANLVLTPLEPGLYALEGVQQLQEIIGLLEDKYQIRVPLKAVLTMFDGHTRFAQTIVQQIREQLPVTLSDVQIRHTVRAREAAYFGKPLCEFAPASTAANDYQQLADEILAAGDKPEVTFVDRNGVAARQENLEESSMSESSGKPVRRMVVLTFNDIECTRLQLAGDFNNWVPDQNVETRNINGHWQKVFTAEPGVYEYRLLVDGKWQADPTNPHEIPNELGGINSLLQVPVQH